MSGRFFSSRCGAAAHVANVCEVALNVRRVSERERTGLICGELLEREHEGKCQ